MPLHRTIEKDKALLLAAVKHGQVPQGQDLWNAMIQAVGDGATERAVRYSKFVLILVTA